MDSKSETSYRRRVHGLPESDIGDCENWPSLDEGSLPDVNRQLYLRRKMAIRMYLEGASENAILNTTGMRRSHIYRLIRERCLSVHPDGLIWGWRALIPHLRIKSYRRKKPVRVNVITGAGAAGALQTVLDLHPDLRRNFEKRILKSPAKAQLGLVKQPRKAHWVWFSDQLRSLGYEIRNEWPFNTQTIGYNAICRYIDYVLNSNPNKAVSAIGGPDLKRKFLAGDGVDRPITDIFDRVEMDAHKLDGRFCVMFPQPSGGYSPKIIHRIWVIVLIEIISRAVLGYHLSFGYEISKNDVLRAIKKSLSSWRKRNITFGNVYKEGAGFPSSSSTFFLRACWKETSVDGALAEKAKCVVDVLKDVVGSKLLTPQEGYSSRRSLDDRPFIEAFFKNISSGGFQRFSNTTGGKPAEKQGRNPDEVAVTSQFQVEFVEELLDVLIANYNVSPHSSLGGRSPLEYLSFLEARGQTKLTYADPNSVQSILSYRKKCLVHGGIKEGRKPFVNFENAQYRGEVLSQRQDLVGKYIWVINHLEDDARVVEASTLEGLSLGILRAAPPWHKIPHSLQIRKAINSYMRDRIYSASSESDVVEMFMEYCEQQKDKKLPVHPAYLELRRILEQEAEKVIVDAPIENVDFKICNSLDSKKSNPSEATSAPNKKKLPIRRLAAS